MKGLERSLKYAAESAGKKTLYALGLGLLNMLWFALMTGDDETTIYSFIARYPAYAVMIGGILLAIYNLLGHSVYLPQHIAYGGMRKHVAIGLVAENIICIIEQMIGIYAITLIFSYVFNTDCMKISHIILALYYYLFVTAFGMCGGILIAKVGKVGYVVIVAFYCGLMGMLFSLFISGQMAAVNLTENLVTGKWGLVLLVFVIGCQFLGGLLTYFFARKMEVR